jgi:hypothetical protein
MKKSKFYVGRFLKVANTTPRIIAIVITPMPMNAKMYFGS